MGDSGKVIALLIDAENVSPRYISVMLSELSGYGTPAYKRIYGDWTSTEMSSWKKQLLESNLTPIQQFSYTQGKNASDSAMIIDAMDILYTKNCDGFCLVSSDSDFTRLASRLRESRMFVIGMGESKTPAAFKNACDTFKYLDVLLKAKSAEDAQSAARHRPKAGPPQAVPKKPAAGKAAAKLQGGKKPPAEPAFALPEPPAAPDADTAAPAVYPGDFEDAAGGFVPLEDIVRRTREIIDKDSEEDGFMSLSQVGSILGRLYPDFDTRNYGFTKLHKLIEYTGDFETRYDQIPGGGKNLMVKNK